MATFNVEIKRDNTIFMTEGNETVFSKTLDGIAFLLNQHKMMHPAKCGIGITNNVQGDATTMVYFDNGKVECSVVKTSALKDLCAVPYTKTITMGDAELEKDIEDPVIIPAIANRYFEMNKAFLGGYENNPELATEFLEIVESFLEYREYNDTYTIIFCAFYPTSKKVYMDIGGLSKTLARLAHNHLETNGKSVDDFTIHVKIDYEDEGSYDLVFKAIEGTQIDVTDNPTKLKNRIVGIDLLNNSYFNVSQCVEA